MDIYTKEETLQIAATFLTSLKKHHIITANSLLLLEAQKSVGLQQSLREADLVIPDSSGVSWASLTLHLSKLNRYPGIDLAYELCGEAEKTGSPVYLLGGESSVSMRAAQYLYKQYPSLNIAGMRDGYFQVRDERPIIDDIARSQSRLVLVALGMPRQEYWIRKNWDRLPPALYIGVGGTFDIWAGRFGRAPSLLRQTGLEWLYRFGQQPSRWRRMAQLPRFALKVISRRK